MNNINKTPGDSQVQGQQSPGNKKVINLSRYKDADGLWVSLYQNSTFFICWIYGEDSDILSMLEMGNVSVSDLLQTIQSSTYAYECYTPEAVDLFVNSCIASGEYHVDTKCLKPGKLSVIIRDADEVWEMFSVDIMKS